MHNYKTDIFCKFSCCLFVWHLHRTPHWFCQEHICHDAFFMQCGLLLFLKRKLNSSFHSLIIQWNGIWNLLLCGWRTSLTSWHVQYCKWNCFNLPSVCVWTWSCKILSNFTLASSNILLIVAKLWRSTLWKEVYKSLLTRIFKICIVILLVCRISSFRIVLEMTWKKKLLFVFFHQCYADPTDIISECNINCRLWFTFEFMQSTSLVL